MAKEPTEAQLEARRKFGEAAKARAAARKAAKEEQANPVLLEEEIDQEQGRAPDIAPGQEPATTISQVEYLNLLQQINELKSQGFAPQPTGGVGLKNGQLTGTFEKYNISPTNYPDPRSRLAIERRLAPFAFDINYHLNWNIAVTEYTSIDQIRTKEPKFTLELGRKLFDDETGDPKVSEDGNQMGYIVCRLIMHEDPEAALVIAREQGIEVDETNEADFLNEMRYLRMRDWLIECFFPAPVKAQRGKKEMVVGGTVVETFEITSHDEPGKIPFDQIKNKKLRG